MQPHDATKSDRLQRPLFIIWLGRLYATATFIALRREALVRRVVRFRVQLSLGE